MNDLKTVRDALTSAIKRLETIKETFPAISVDSDIKIYRDAIPIIDRMIKIPAQTEKVDLDDLVKEVVSKNNDVFLALHSDHIRWVVEYLANAGRLR